MGEERVEGRVLVVDDDPELRRLTARVLTKATDGQLQPLEVEVLLSSPSSAIVRGLREPEVEARE